VAADIIEHVDVDPVAWLKFQAYDVPDEVDAIGVAVSEKIE
jgi:hypothetical protein